ncbi:peptidylprolyl isomerase [Arenimonas alkanexedens]
MTLRPALLTLALALPLGSAYATSPPKKALTMQDVLEASTAADWRSPDPEQTLYLELDSGRVVIELAPMFAPAHAANIRTLVAAGYFNGLSINRSQDNFVVQWGDANGEDPTQARPLGQAKPKLPAEFVRPADGLAFTPLADTDGWAPQVGFVQGFPAARDPDAGLAWLAHCYGTVGAGRAAAADSSVGSELYVVTGQSPRQLDRNITTVGRVLLGMERLSVLPRGTGPLGFYEQAGQRAPIRAIRLASEVPEAERTRLEVFRTDTAAFADLVESRRNRRDDWYVHPAGHIDLCNVPVPVREAPAAN